MYTAPLSLLHTHILSVYLHLPLNRSTSLSTLCSAFYFPFSFTTSSLYLCLPLSVSLAFSLSLSLHPFFLSVSFYLFILLFLFLPFVSLSSPIRSLSLLPFFLCQTEWMNTLQIWKAGRGWMEVCVCNRASCWDLLKGMFSTLSSGFCVNKKRVSATVLL